MAKKKITQLDLFSGIGGFHLGFEKAGFKVKSYFSEIDKHAIAVYKHQFKDAEYVGSVTDIRGEQLPKIDLITFGSPCQDFSLAGKRKGMEGERSSLVLEAIRLIDECRPSVFIWENVKGTFSSNNGADFAAILQAFANIGSYRLEWQLLNTSWFPRTPQNRERIYLVGYSTTPGGDWRGVFPLGEASNKPIKRKTKIASALQHPGHSGGNYRGMNMIAEVQVKSATSKGYEEATDIRGNEQIATIRSGGRGSLTAKHSWDIVKVKSANKQGYEEAQEGDSINLSQPNSETRRGRVGKGKAQTLETSCNQAVVEPKLKFIGAVSDSKWLDNGKNLSRNFSQGNRVYSDEGISPALSSQMGGQTKGSGLIQSNYRIRRLTPIECERLQGFPDNHTEYGNYDGEVKKMSNTQRYKQCGNAVTVDVVQAVAEQLKPIYNA